MKGIILAGGAGTRLYPLTQGVCKQLLPIYDKPLIYYPLSVLMLAGIRDIVIISTPMDLPRFRELLGTGEDLGMQFSYKEQAEPRGIAEALIIGEDAVGDDGVALILGDNIFYGQGLMEMLQGPTLGRDGATVFGYYVKDPERYGVMTFDGAGRVIAIDEKPTHPSSRWAVTGIYFFDRDAVQIAKALRPSARGEREITDVINAYLRQGRLTARLLGRGVAWLDTGTHDSLIDAGMFIRTIEDRQGLKIGCIEEVAFRKGFISRAQLLKLSTRSGNQYGRYLKEIAERVNDGHRV